MTDDRIPVDAATGFGRGAEVYERSRPSYPAEAVACIVGRAGIGPGRRVLDLAAGTGKLTRLLVPSGCDMVAVEPLSEMREQMRGVLPDLEILDGTAEAIPLGDASVDVVTVAQAVQWFDLERAVPEVLRVLRPGGALVVVYSLQDQRVAWVDRYMAALSTGRALPFHLYETHDYGTEISAVAGSALQEHGSFTCEWGQPMDAEMMVERAAAVSVVSSLPTAERDEVLARVAHVAANDPDLAGRSMFFLPHTTHVLWWNRP